MEAHIAELNIAFDGLPVFLFREKAVSVLLDDLRGIHHLGLFVQKAGDTLDVRQIKAVIEYDGKHYLAEARWLKFFFVTASIGKFSNAYKQKWVVRDGKLQNVSILHQGDRIVE